jgi:hypothetical protein
MRLALTVLTTFVLLGCSPENPHRLRLPSSPAAPEPAPPQPSSSAFVWAMVVEANGSGVCIADATVEVVAGQARGQSATQTEPCDVWGYSGGIEFHDLTPGVAMTLRASAPGFTAQERRVVPSSGPTSALIFELSNSR